ncbi:CBS domain-containing protein [Mesobacillus jeotgali]|uniref:CBS domain-containing protein n=1 Tax=Mesobacillus jeotgali TaxID=129985 RepID=UPI001CE305DB|nr:CBS domain-containing protein [Mesobacillus jeotgali]UYZ22747.1 CBS domain-containing protein [Mesobacillus jeotgali]
MANNTQAKHKSNNQSGSKNKMNHQTGKNKRKSYMNTNPRPQEKEENRLKRVDERNQKQDGNKGSENGKPSYQSKRENGNSSSNHSKNDKSKSANQQAGNGNGNTSSDPSKNGKENVKPASNQSKNGKPASNPSHNGKENGKPASNQSINGNGKKGGNETGKNSSNKNPDSGAKTPEDQEVKHKEQSGKFETAFNRIHKALKEMVKGTDSDAFVELLYSGYKNHSLVRKYKSELHQFAKLRNAIVHERVNADYYIAEPHIEVVERIEEIAREFEKPQTALSIATSPVFYYYEDAYLKDVLKVINKFDFTRFPVYDKDDKYVALLTSTEIIQWMAKHFSDSVVHFEDVRVKELLTKGKNYFVTFVDEDASLYHIEELFERYHTRGKKLQAVIITETGDRHGKPIGVITPWDLLDSDPED